MTEAFAPLGDYLLWVAHFGSESQEWLLHDHSGTFSPESLLPRLPPGVPVPNTPSMGSLVTVFPLQSYWVMVSEDRAAVFGGIIEKFIASEPNLIRW